MRRLARQALALAFGALAALASVSPAFAQEPPPEAERVAPRAATTPRERVRTRIEGIREERLRAGREAPPGFGVWMRELPALHRRQLDRQLRRMPPLQRERFFREWSRLPLHERRTLADRLALAAEARRLRELPLRLRTPEMRDRLGRMSPEERRDFASRVRDWREMDAGERIRMRARLENFGALSADKQQALVEEHFKRSSPEERARILNHLRAASLQLRGSGDAGERAAEPSAPRAPPDAAPPAP